MVISCVCVRINAESHSPFRFAPIIIIIIIIVYDDGDNLIVRMEK